MRPVACLCTGALLAVTLSCGSSLAPGDDPAVAAQSLKRAREVLDGDGAGCATALPLLARACADPDVCADALPLLALCFRVRQIPEDGVLFFDRVAERHPELAPRLLPFRGYTLHLSGEVDAALRAYASALREAPDPMTARLYSALLERLGRHEEAAEVVRVGLDLAPNDPIQRLRLARLSRRRGRLDEAESLLRDLMAEPGYPSEAWLEAGKLLAARGDEEAARETWRRGALADPAQLEVRYLLAKDALRAGRRGEFDHLLSQIRAIEATLGRGPREE